MDWSELWAYYNRVGEAIKQEILRQLDLRNWLPNVSAKVRIEVLKFAPVEIQRMYNTSLPSKSPEQLRREVTRIFSK